MRPSRTQEQNRIRTRAYSHRQRAKVIVALGGACAVCGNSDARVLQADHVGGGGNEHRRRVPSPNSYKLEIISEPEKFQLLCANCHAIKSFEEAVARRIHAA